MFLVLLAMTVGSALALIWVFGHYPPPSAPSAELIIDAYRDHISPKPTERLIFAVLAVMVPIWAFLFLIFAPELRPGPEPSRHLLDLVLPAVIAAVLLIPFFASDFLATVLGRYGSTRAR